MALHQNRDGGCTLGAGSSGRSTWNWYLGPWSWSWQGHPEDLKSMSLGTGLGAGVRSAGTGARVLGANMSVGVSMVWRDPGVSWLKEWKPVWRPACGPTECQRRRPTMTCPEARCVQGGLLWDQRWGLRSTRENVPQRRGIPAALLWGARLRSGEG